MALNKLGIFTAAIAVVMVSACTTPASGPAGPTRIDPFDTRTLTSKPNMADYLRMAQRITEQMLSSDAIGGASRPPRLILTDRAPQTFNDTSDETIEVREIFETIVQTIRDSGAARYVRSTSNAFDLVMTPRLSESVETAPGQPVQTIYRMCITLTDLSSEEVGQWCDFLGFKE